MGYTARLIQGDTFVVPAEAIPALYALIAEWEKKPWVVSMVGGNFEKQYPHEHLSWCHPIAQYEPTVDGLCELLEHTGFDTEGFADGAHVYGWQGDKIGSSWESLWGMLATVVPGLVHWYMIGEDGHLWVETIEGHKHRTYRAELTIRRGEAS